MMNGWIKLHRDILNWGWYKKSRTLHLFIHLLLSANHKQSHVFGKTVNRGQLVTGRKVLAQETGMTEQQIRTALKHLKSTNEITIETTKTESFITVVNYEKYQGNGIESNQESNQRSNQELTKNQPRSNHKQEGKKGKNDKKEEIPARDEFLAHAKEKCNKLGYEYNEQAILTKYEAWKEAGWKDGKGNKIKSWKSKLTNTLPYICNSKRKQVVVNKGFSE